MPAVHPCDVPNFFPFLAVLLSSPPFRFPAMFGVSHSSPLTLLPPSSLCAMLTVDNTVIHKFLCSGKSCSQQHSKPLKGVGNLTRGMDFSLFQAFRCTALL